MTDLNIKKIKSDKLDDLCATYDLISQQIKELEMRKKRAKKAIMDIVKDADKVQSVRYLVTASMTKDNPGTLITKAMIGTCYGAHKGYRMFKVTNNLIGGE